MLPLFRAVLKLCSTNRLLTTVSHVSFMLLINVRVLAKCCILLLFIALDYKIIDFFIDTGDLLYLDIITLEENKYSVTASSNGFYINRLVLLFITLKKLVTLLSCSEIKGENFMSYLPSATLTNQRAGMSKPGGRGDIGPLHVFHKIACFP